MAEVDGSRLEALIHDRKTSQTKLARAVGIAQPSIGRLISGETRETGKLLEIARALRTSAAYLTRQTDDPSPDAVGQMELSAEHLELLELIDRLDPEDRVAVLQIVRKLTGVANGLTVHAGRLDYKGEDQA